MMRESDSVFIPVRGLNYHCRTWGDPANPRLFLLHGFQDVSASWQFTADALTRDWYVVAPDWRGYGLSDPSGQDTYWYPDLVADLDVILDHFESSCKRPFGPSLLFLFIALPASGDSGSTQSS